MIRFNSPSFIIRWLVQDRADNVRYWRCPCDGGKTVHNKDVLVILIDS